MHFILKDYFINIIFNLTVRVYILGPASVAIDSRSLSVFLAVWRRGAGHVILGLSKDY